jgi:hypothetical protein
LLTIALQNGQLEKSQLDIRTDVLVAELDRFAGDDSRPSAALQARSMRLMVELLRTEANDPDPTFRELKAVVEQCEHLIGYPLEPLVEILTTIGGRFGDSAAFDDLFLTIEEVWSRRKGDLAAARLQLSRGAQQLDADRPLQAIRTLGRALTRLFKDESRDELVQALYLCSSAYERIGLLWAARGSAVTAAALATDEFWKYEDVTRLQAGCYNRLKWIELQLGRIPQTLAWHELDGIVRGVLQAKGISTAIFDDDGGDESFDAILGIHFLRLDVWLLKDLGRLPSSLESMRLYASSLALRYALGDEEGAAEDLQVDGSAGDSLQSQFIRWRDQPASDDMRHEPELGQQQKLRLRTSVTGCDVVVECQNEQHCLSVAESLLASLESLLATGLADRVFARQPKLVVRVSHSDFCDPPFSHEIVEKDGVIGIEIRCADFDPNKMSYEEQAEAKKCLLDTVVSCICNCFYVGDTDSLIDRMFGDERAVDRAVHFTSSFVVLGNVLGNSPRTSIDDWIRKDDSEVRLARSTKWDDGCEPDTLPEENDQPIKFGTGRPSGQSFNPEDIKHFQMQLVSLIREPLWNRAGWAGTAVVVFDEPSSPPFLLPAFRDADAAAAIFRGLREDVGEADGEDRLRVVLVRGISRSNPHAYRVIFGTQMPQNLKSSRWKMVALAARINTMEPATSENIDRFLARYATVNVYAVAPCVMDINGEIGEPMFDLHIKKRHIHVRDAWQIGLNDLDSTGILPEDDPIIPQGESDPPVLDLLKRKRQQDNQQ